MTTGAHPRKFVQGEFDPPACGGRKREQVGGWDKRAQVAKAKMKSPLPPAGGEGGGKRHGHAHRSCRDVLRIPPSHSPRKRGEGLFPASLLPCLPRHLPPSSPLPLPPLAGGGFIPRRPASLPPCFPTSLLPCHLSRATCHQVPPSHSPRLRGEGFFAAPRLPATCHPPLATLIGRCHNFMP
jgi:hypothetical protein